MVDPQSLRETLRYWASGVSVVTTALMDEDGVTALDQSGMTVSAFNSLSLDPAQILVCLYKEANTAQLVMKAGHFAVSFLPTGRGDLSDRFAGRIARLEGSERFSGVAVQRAVTGSPILSEAVAWLDCKIHAAHDGNTHWIVIGSVQATGRGESSQPLVYFDRRYRALMADDAV